MAEKTVSFEEKRSNKTNYLYHQYDEDLFFPAHFHDSFEFLYCYEGKLKLSVDKDEFYLEAGEAALILPNQIHLYETVGHSKSYLCIFSTNYLDAFYPSAAKECAQNPVFSINDRLYLLDDIQHSEDSYLIRSAFYYIASLYSKLPKVPREKKFTTLIGQVLSYVEEHYEENISLEDFSRRVGYDYHYLSNVVNDGLKENFRSYLNRYRVQKAIELLQRGEVQIQEVAEKVGYDSLRTFNRNFLKIVGKTPRDFRQEIMEQKYEETNL